VGCARARRTGSLRRPRTRRQPRCEQRSFLAAACAYSPHDPSTAGTESSPTHSPTHNSSIAGGTDSPPPTHTSTAGCH
jgi:hypothetical protein